ncbi:MAG: DUF3306 domain-containing protein [Betaproteobacteria bacterium]
MAGDDGEGFFSRWSRRKVRQKEGVRPGIEAREPLAPRPDCLPAESEKEPLTPAGEGQGETAAQAAAEPPPTLADVAALTRDSDFTRFVAPGVDETVKRAALKKMFFSDPHFNVMDGLDVYIDDYNKPDPLPASMLRQMWQSKSLGLFDDEADPAAPAPQASPDGAAGAPVPQSGADLAAAADPPDEDTDLRLQPDDDAGRPGAREGARPERG